MTSLALNGRFLSRCATKTPIFSLAYPTLFIVLEKTDPPGTYKLEAVIRDKVTQASAVDVYQFDYSK